MPDEINAGGCIPRWRQFVFEPRSRDAIALILVFGVITVVFSRTLFMGKVLAFGDASYQFYPWQTYLAHARLMGTWFPWSSEIGAGYPMWADGQSGAFYLPNLLFLLPFDSAWLFGFVTCAHYYLAAAGMFCLVRLFGLGRRGAAVSAALFALTGFMALQEFCYAFVAGAAWIPWIAYGVIVWGSQRRFSGFVVASIGCAVQPLCHVQLVFFAALFTVGAVLTYRSQQGPNGHQWRHPTCLVSICLPWIAGMLLCAIQLFPVLVISSYCGAERRGYEYTILGSLPPLQLLTLALPNFFGDRLSYWGKSIPWEVNAYSGALACILVALVRPTHSAMQRTRRGLLLLGGIALLLALGGYTPVYRLLYYIPGLNRFRCPGRWVMVWGGAFSILCGIAVHDLPRRLTEEAFARRTAKLLAVLAVGALGVSLWMRYGKDANIAIIQALLHRAGEGAKRYDSFAGYICKDLIQCVFALGIAAAALALRACRRLTIAATVTAVMLAITVESAVFMWQYNPVSPRSYYAPSSLTREICRDSSAFGRVLFSGYPGDENRLFPGAALRSPVNGVSSVLQGFSRPDSYGAMAPPIMSLINQLGAMRRATPSVAAVLGCDLLVTPDHRDTARPGWQVLAQPEGNRVYRNTAYRGMAWTVGQTTTEDRLLADISQLDTSLDYMIDCPAVYPPLQDSPNTTRHSKTVTVSRPAWHHYRFTIGEGTDSFLFVSLSALPGWRAEVNGKPEPIRRANYAFMAVPVPKEPCTVDLYYAPYGLGTGALLSLAGVLLILATGIASRRKACPL